MEGEGAGKMRVSRRRLFGLTAAVAATGAVAVAGGLAAEYGLNENEIKAQRDIWDNFSKLPVAGELNNSAVVRYDADWDDVERLKLEGILGKPIRDKHMSVRLEDGMTATSGVYPGYRLIRDGKTRYLNTDDNQKYLQQILGKGETLRGLYQTGPLINQPAIGEALGFNNQIISEVEIYADSNGEWMGNYGSVGLGLQMIFNKIGCRIEVTGNEVPSQNIIGHLESLRRNQSKARAGVLSVVLLDPQTDFLGDMNVFAFNTYTELQQAGAFSAQTMPARDLSGRVTNKMIREAALANSIFNSSYLALKDAELDIAKSLKDPFNQKLFTAHNYLLGCWVRESGSGLVVGLPFADLHPKSADMYQQQVWKQVEQTVDPVGGRSIDLSAVSGPAGFDIYQHPKPTTSLKVAAGVAEILLGKPIDLHLVREVESDLDLRYQNNRDFWINQLDMSKKI